MECTTPEWEVGIVQVVLALLIRYYDKSNANLGFLM